MTNENLIKWLQPQLASFKRAITKEYNPLIKQILEKEQQELEQYILSLKTTKK